LGGGIKIYDPNFFRSLRLQNSIQHTRYTPRLPYKLKPTLQLVMQCGHRSLCGIRSPAGN